MWIGKQANYVESRLSSLMTAVGRIGAGIIAVMMILTVADVVGRRTLNQPLTGAFEITQFMMVIVVFLTIAYCEFTWDHVKVEILVSRLRQKAQDVINSIMYVILLLTFIFMTWELTQLALSAWENDLQTATLRIPAYPIMFVTVLGCALFNLMVLIHLLQFIARAMKK